MYSIAEARNQLPKLVHDAEEIGPVALSRRGKPVAMIISCEEFELLRSPRRTAWDVIQEFRSRPEFDEIALSDEDFKGLRDSAPGRDFRFE
ncbi:MAG: type II toxin-antitoxin system Phd/YefM family antitoxin [Chloroflexota bacterium]